MAEAVWIADPDPQVREGLAALLRTAGLDVRTFGMAEALLRDLRQDRPACVVLDVDLPDLSGLEVLLRIRGRRLDIPVIVLAACADVPLAVCSLHLGAMDFIEKPFVGAVVLARVREAVGRSAHVPQGTLGLRVD
jgi:two-component system response regulator FixJ